MFVLLAISIPLLCISGTWYFWHNPTWVLSLGEGGTYVGPSGSPLVIGDGMTLFIKLLLVAVPVWSVWRFWPRRSRSAEG